MVPYLSCVMPSWKNSILLRNTQTCSNSFLADCVVIRQKKKTIVPSIWVTCFLHNKQKCMLSHVPYLLCTYSSGPSKVGSRSLNFLYVSRPIIAYTYCMGNTVKWVFQFYIQTIIWNWKTHMFCQDVKIFQNYEYYCLWILS